MDIIEALAQEIDRATDTVDVEAVNLSIGKIDDLLGNSQVEDTAILLYFRANCFAALRNFSSSDRAYVLSWKQPELNEEILSLRRAVRSPSFAQLDQVRRCQIWTNLGNVLNTVGRPIAAIAAWDEALAIEPRFAMAAANRAYGLAHYSAAFYDPGHQCIFLNAAADSFRTALSEDAVIDSIYPSSVPAQFERKLGEIEHYISKMCDLSTFDPNAFEVGTCDLSKTLNQWRLTNKLFLNPLNDLAAWPVAAQDVFHLPSHNTKDKNPSFAQYFDLIRQEYVAACVLLFEGLQDQETHPADKTLLVFEHGDYSLSSVHIEKKKAAFRLSYSLLDKCAIFINSYFELGFEPSKVSFRKVWFEDIKKGVINKAAPMENWRLRGLYAVSLDLFDEEFSGVSSPLAVKANKVRNAAEHRFLLVHETMKPEMQDPALESVTGTELTELAMNGLRLARETIMGLSLAVYHQESLRKEKDKSIVVPITPIPKVRE